MALDPGVLRRVWVVCWSLHQGSRKSVDGTIARGRWRCAPKDRECRKKWHWHGTIGTMDLSWSSRIVHSVKGKGMISRAKALVPPTPQLGWAGCPDRELLHMLILYFLWLYRLLLYMYTCLGGIMCSRHTDYIHNYMTIRDMLRHVGWLGFWMNCALM